MTHNEILVLNAGSSSIKFAAFHCDGGLEKSLSGTVENIHTAPKIKIKDNKNLTLLDEQYSDPKAYEFFFDLIFNFLTQRDSKLIACGHRIVHGGTQYHEPIILTPKITNDLKALIPFAPLHQPYNLEAVESIAKNHPKLPQIACFDTAFHWTHPALVDQFGLPYHYFQEGIKRYGFHGLSYEYILKQAQKSIPKDKRKRVIVAHLGNGSSLCAMKNDQSYASSMGFSTLDGLVMGTRCGSIDPGVLLYLMEFHQMDRKDLEKLLYKDSGLLGVSQLSADMRTLQEAAPTNPQAKLAIDLFNFNIVRECGALISTLEGLDQLIFTGGIGENAAFVRTAVCEKLKWLGVVIDETLNQENNKTISSPESTIGVHVFPTNEEAIIAAHTLSLLG